MEEPEGSATTAAPTCRARLRFDLQKKFNVDAAERRLEVAGLELVLSPPKSDSS